MIWTGDAATATGRASGFIHEMKMYGVNGIHARHVGRAPCIPRLDEGGSTQDPHHIMDARWRFAIHGA